MFCALVEYNIIYMPIATRQPYYIQPNARFVRYILLFRKFPVFGCKISYGCLLYGLSMNVAVSALYNLAQVGVASSSMGTGWL